MIETLIYLAAGVAAISPCTIPSDWGTNSVGAPGNADSVGKVLTVPAGNSGTLKFNRAGTANTIDWSTDGVSYTSVANGGTHVFTNGQTVYLRVETNSGGDNTTITVVDNDTGTTVGTFTGSGL